MSITIHGGALWALMLVAGYYLSKDARYETSYILISAKVIIGGLLMGAAAIMAILWIAALTQDNL